MRGVSHTTYFPFEWCLIFIFIHCTHLSCFLFTLEPAADFGDQRNLAKRYQPRPLLITFTCTLIIPDTTNTSSNNCLKLKWNVKALIELA